MATSLPGPHDSEVEYLGRLETTGSYIVVRKPGHSHPRELYVDGRWQHIIMDYTPPRSADRVITSENDRFRFSTGEYTLNGEAFEQLKIQEYDVVFLDGLQVRVTPRSEAPDDRH